MTALRLKKNQTITKVMKACMEITKRNTNPRYGRIRYVAENDEIYATNGIQLIIYGIDTHLSDKNCTVSMAGEYLILDEEEFEDIQYRKPLDIIDSGEVVCIPWESHCGYEPYEILEILSERRIKVQYKVLGVFKHLRDIVDEVCFDKNPQAAAKPIEFRGAHIKYLIMPLIKN